MRNYDVITGVTSSKPSFLWWAMSRSNFWGVIVRLSPSLHFRPPPIQIQLIFGLEKAELIVSPIQSTHNQAGKLKTLKTASWPGALLLQWQNYDIYLVIIMESWIASPTVLWGTDLDEEYTSRGSVQLISEHTHHLSYKDGKTRLNRKINFDNRKIMITLKRRERRIQNKIKRK